MKTNIRANQFDAYRKQTKPNQNRKLNANQPHDTLKGVILNQHIKKQDSYESIDDFDRISCSLLIPDKVEPKVEEKKSENSFDYKKALKPLLIGTGAVLGSVGLISFAVKRYSKVLATKNDVVRPGDLARNINILEEPHFAMYRLLRDPNAKNFAGFIGVCAMSVVTLTAKNFIDGAKEIWTKKQNCDIEHDLQENLIQVETDAFSGKLNVVNTLLSDTTKYFKSVLSSDKKQAETTTNFKSFLTFKGENKAQPKNGENDEKSNKTDNKKTLKTLAAMSLGVAGLVGVSYLMFRNYQKTLKNLDDFTRKFEHREIESKIQNAVQNPDKPSAIRGLIDIFKVINATDTTMQTNLSKIDGITPEEIAKAIREVKEAQIYAQAPEALGGISEKIQYYCYINEERGHLYNWILNPENKFNKYLFLAFSALSATGYVGKQTVDAVKDVVVSRENSKSELALKRKLVQTEINNFKAKKMSAINPLIDNFMHQVEQGKSKEELKELAENILVEIKNGPPYVYA
ncbi:hypothetical protein IJ425_02070 [bacterium]|nr:hypothetical protein [bacterium]